MSAPRPRFLDPATPPTLFTLVVASALSALSLSFFVPSLPKMAAHFDTPFAVMQLSVPLFLGMNAILQLFVGPFSDRYGRRPILLGSFVIFIAATIGCVLSPDIITFLAFRLLQAIVVAAMVLSRAVVRDMHGSARAASTIGYVTMGMAVAPMLGPTAGGILDQYFGWQSTFWAMTVLGVLVLALIWRDQGETVQGRSASFAAQFRDYPELFRSRRFWGYTATSGLSASAFYAYIGSAPLVATGHYGLGSALTGMFLGIPPVGYFFGNWVSGHNSERFGIDNMIMTGTILTCLGLAACWLVLSTGASHPLAFFGFAVFVGLGNGMVMPNATAGFLSVHTHLAGTASGVGGALTIAAGGALAALAGVFVTPEGGPWPLLALMLAASASSVLTAAYVLRTARAAAVG